MPQSRALRIAVWTSAVIIAGAATALLATLHDASRNRRLHDDVRTGTLDNITPVVITYTETSLPPSSGGNGVPDYEVVMTVASATSYRTDGRYVGQPDAPSNTSVVSGTVSMLGTFDDGVAWWDYGDMQTEMPTFLDDMPSQGIVGQLRQITPPVLDMAAVDALVDAGILADAGTGVSLGRPVRIITASDESAGRAILGRCDRITVTLDSDYGIRHSIQERVRDSRHVNEFQAQAMQQNVELTPGYLSVSSSAHDYVERELAVPFDDGANPLIAGRALAVLVPETGELGNGWSVLSTTYLSRVVSDIASLTLLSVDEWLVVHTLHGPDGQAGAVIQGPNDPSYGRAVAYWPYFLDDAHPELVASEAASDPAHYYAAVESVQLVEAQNEFVLSYRPELEGSGFPFKYLVSWTYDTDLRAVVAGDWEVPDAATMVALANAVIAASARP